MTDSTDEPGIRVLDEQTANAVGGGLLGFSAKPLSRGDEAYFNALGLTKDQLDQVLRDLRDGMSPLTRPRAKISLPQPT